MSDEMMFIEPRYKPDGTKIVSGHWRRQKRALTAEQRLQKQRDELVEQAKREQREEGLL